MKTRASLKYFVNDCLWKHNFAPQLPQIASDLVCLTILVILITFIQLLLKSKAINFQRSENSQ